MKLDTIKIKLEIIDQKKAFIKFVLQELGFNQQFFDSKNGKYGLLLDLKSLWLLKDTTNFQTIVENKIIRVHKEILNIFSGLYRGMFLNINKEQNSVKDHSNRSFSSVYALIRYFYFQDFEKNLSKNTSQELGDAREYYQLDDYDPISFQLLQILK